MAQGSLDAMSSNTEVIFCWSLKRTQPRATIKSHCMPSTIHVIACTVLRKFICAAGTFKTSGKFCSEKMIAFLDTA
jgi:hypothetical protein